MCGICGWLNFEPENIVDREQLIRMTRTLAHRGPDGEGVYCDKNFAMGHRRLSIIDIDSGKQPLANEDESIWVCFNGEIYNYLELMSQLKQQGHIFRTESDTEVLVHLYEEYGEAMFVHLRGMFAFSIWDSRQKKLLLARDRVGKKPLYFHHVDGKHLIFGSEIKAVLASTKCPQQLSYQALDQYLSYLYVPTPGTIYSAIAKLPAGHYLVAGADGVRTREYWDLHYPEQKGGRAKSDGEYLEEFQSVVKDAVRIRLRSDVPLGAFLSGGIDSSVVVGLMTELMDLRVETVSVGFKEKEYDELAYAKEIAEIFGCNFNEYLVEANPDSALALIDKLLGYFDEPFADPSFIPTYFVSQAARQKVTVALSGDGGDESVAGYARHSIALLEARLRNYTRFLPQNSLQALYGILPRGTKGRNIIGNLAESPAEAAARKHSNVLFTRELKELIYGDDGMITDVAERFRNLYEQSTAGNVLDKNLYLDMKTYLADDILVKVDRMSMAVGLEVRAPLLDHKVLEFLATVPPHLKLHNGSTKFLLKQLLARKVPQSILQRKKQGFRLPIELWLKGELRFLVEDIIESRQFRERGIFNIKGVQKMWSDFLGGRQDYAHHFWQLLVLERWFRMSGVEM